MAKRKKIYSKTQKKSLQPYGIASSELEIHPNATLNPTASLENPTTGTLISRDSTSAPIIDEEESREPYARSHSELLDKYIMHTFGRRYILFLLVIIVIGYIFTQDNNAGRLSNWNDIKWFLLKSGVFLAIVLVILGSQWLYKKFVKEEGEQIKWPERLHIS